MVVSDISQPVGPVYALIAITFIIYLYRSGRFSTPVQMLLLVISSVSGCRVLVRIAPYQFQQVLFRDISRRIIPFVPVLFLPGIVHCDPLGDTKRVLQRCFSYMSSSIVTISGSGTQSLYSLEMGTPVRLMEYWYTPIEDPKSDGI